jgi:hypothetical protein
MRRPSWRTSAKILLVAVGFAFVFGIYFANHGYFCTHSRMNADEGFYAIAARSVMRGQLPYRDFGYTQMPLLPYANGLAMTFAGFGLTSQRVCNILWTALGLLGLAMALYKRTGSLEPAALAVFFAGTSPFAAEFTAQGASHGVTTCFTCLSAAAVLWPGGLLPRTIAFALFGTMTVGCRLAMSPMIFFLTLALFAEARTWKQRAIVLGIPIGVGLLAIGPFLLASPEGFWFFNWEYHVGSSFDRRRLEGQPTEWWKAGHGALVVLFMGLAGLRHLFRGRRWQDILLLVAGVAGVLAPMAPKSGYGWYIIPAVPVAAAVGLSALWGRVESPEPRYPFRHFLWALPMLLLLMPFPLEVSTGKPTTFSAMAAWTRDTVLLRETPPRKPNERTAGFVEDIADYLRNKVPPGPVLTSLPIVAVEAKREVWPGTHMGMFAAMDPGQDMRARRLNLTTISLLTEAVRSRKPAAIVKLVGSSVWNFKWRVPSLRRQPDRIYTAYEKAIAENYEMAFKSGNLELLVPRKN